VATASGPTCPTVLKACVLSLHLCCWLQYANDAQLPPSISTQDFAHWSILIPVIIRSLTSWTITWVFVCLKSSMYFPWVKNAFTINTQALWLSCYVSFWLIKQLTWPVVAQRASFYLGLRNIIYMRFSKKASPYIGAKVKGFAIKSLIVNTKFGALVCVEDLLINCIGSR
jgi:hypothetical protein